MSIHEIPRWNSTAEGFKSLLLTQDQDKFILYGRAFQDNEPKIREDLSKSVLR